MSKAIYFAGVSRLNGELKFRTAQSPARFQQLTKLGDTEVEMTSVNADSKEQAAQELIDRNFANGRTEILALLTAVAGKVSKPKTERTVKVKAKKIATKEKKLSIEEANARVLATVREVTAEEAMRRLVFGAVKARRTRKTKEAV